MKTVALVGRPNVGKSRLFNRLIKKRVAIVEGRPGITRDRVERTVEWDGSVVRVIDTGGIGSDDSLREQIQLQAGIAMAAADLILLVVDIRDGLLPLDEEIAAGLRGRGKTVMVVANKADSAAAEQSWAEFARLGFATVLPVSAEHGRGFDDLVDAIRNSLGALEEEETEQAVIRLAIVGRPNVGKSSLLNALLGSARAIVSEEPGTTRDAIEETIDLPQGRIALVDTAGIRRRRRDYDLLESIMVSRTADAVSASDVALVIVDAVEGLTDQDVKILNAVFANGKGAVIGLNKWDALEAKDFDRIVARMKRRLGTEAHVPIVSISALKKVRLRRLLEKALEVGANMRNQISTADFNRILANMSRRAPKGMRVKYGVQKTTVPPTFVLFGSSRPPLSFERYARNEIRRAGGFDGVPIVLEFRK